MILGNPQSPKIGLLQGPPGTGKSSTVVGIVEKVLQVIQVHHLPDTKSSLLTKHSPETYHQPLLMYIYHNMTIVEFCMK